MGKKKDSTTEVMDVDCNVEVTENPEEKKARRQRKKLLYKNIREQIEFYFSDSNLPKDKFLGQLVMDHPEGFIPLEIFKSFNRIKKHTTDIAVIIKALQKSEILELNEEKTKVRRTTPIKVLKNTDECTIYVEHLPETASHDWLKEIFEKYGPIAYISLPKVKRNNVKIPKGFAFVEFDSPETRNNLFAKLAEIEKNENEEFAKKLEAEDKGKEVEMAETKAEKKKKKKRKRDSLSPSGIEEHENKKTKYDETIDVPSIKKEDDNQIGMDEECFKEEKSNKMIILKVLRPPEEPTEEKEAEDKDDPESKLLKKKRHTKVKFGKKPKSSEKYANLRILTKEEWIQYRKDYLSNQKEITSHLKKTLLAGTLPSIAGEKEIVDVKNVILHLELNSAIEDLPGFKKAVRDVGKPEYIDAQLGQQEAFIRCTSLESSQELAQNLLAKFKGKVTVLKGKEEENYMLKIQQDRQDKFDKKVQQKRKRGRDKVFSRVKIFEKQAETNFEY